MSEIALITIVALLIVVLIQQVLFNQYIKTSKEVILYLEESNEELQYTIDSLKDDIFNLEEQGGLFNEN